MEMLPSLPRLPWLAIHRLLLRLLFLLPQLRAAGSFKATMTCLIPWHRHRTVEIVILKRRALFLVTPTCMVRPTLGLTVLRLGRCKIMQTLPLPAYPVLLPQLPSQRSNLPHLPRKDPTRAPSHPSCPRPLLRMLKKESNLIHIMTSCFAHFPPQDFCINSSSKNTHNSPFLFLFPISKAHTHTQTK